MCQVTRLHGNNVLFPIGANYSTPEQYRKEVSVCQKAAKNAKNTDEDASKQVKIGSIWRQICPQGVV